MGNLIYELPTEMEIVAEVVRALPSDWLAFEGILFAPRELYLQERIVKNTRLRLSNSHYFNPIIDAVDDVPFELLNWKRKENKSIRVPNFYGLFVEGKYPSSIEFDDVNGTVKYGIALSQARDLASEFIRRGYKGTVRARTADLDDYGICNGQKFGLWHYRPDFEKSVKNYLLNTVILEWHDIHGSKENLTTLIEEFEKLGLKQLPSRELIS